MFKKFLSKGYVGSRSRPLGVSLAETVISLGLLGIVLIPSLFVSSAWFNQQLMMMRENMRVVHSASQFMNGFLNELSKAQTILPDSTATEVHFTYYDPVKQERIKRGYRLTDDSGTRYMERLQYNESASGWLAISPYATEEAESIRLPATAEFKYCQGAVCTVNPERALYV
ncbi:MAG: hypothetical protein KTR14_00850 [Vampirovibrio sp.]|nr:hypothetical protein [Vampirovibrio sp.]